MNLRVPAVCLVTDRARLAEPTDDELVRLVECAGAAGVDLIHLRERNRDGGDLLRLARRLVGSTRGTSARIVVNDRVDVAVAAAAAGVHLRADSFGAARVRQIAPPDFLVGRSVHSIAEATDAAGSSVDYVLFGTVYPSASKSADLRLAGIGGLGAVCRAVSVPVLAIGGVTTDKLGELAAAGASGIAAIGLFIDAYYESRGQNPLATLAEIVATIRQAFHRPRRAG